MSCTSAPADDWEDEASDGDELLSQFLARAGTLPLFQGLALASQLLWSLDTLHRRGRVHGSIDAHTLVVSRTGRLKVLRPAVAPVLPDCSVTQPPAGPELAEVQVGQSSDLHAAAVVTCDLLGRPKHSGQVPQDGPSRAALPPHLEAVLQRALSPIPGERYATAAEFSAALHRAVPAPCWDRSAPVRGRPDASGADGHHRVAVRSEAVRVPSHPQTSGPAKRRRRLGWALGIATACALVGVGAGVLSPLRGGVRPTASSRSDAVPAQPMLRPASSQPQAGTTTNTAAVAIPSAAQPPVAPVRAAARAPDPDGSSAVGSGSTAGMHAAVDGAPRLARAQDQEQPRRREHRPSDVTRLAALRQRLPHATHAMSPDPEQACGQDLVAARQLCVAIRCATAEYRQHPVCVRMHAEGAVARAQLAESRGGP